MRTPRPHPQLCGSSERRFPSFEGLQGRLPLPERPVHRTGPHPLAYLRPFSLLTLGAASGVALLRVLPPWAGCAVLFASALLSIPAILEKASLDCRLTDMRLTVRRGWLLRRTTETTLDKVGGVAVEQSLLGRLLGYGDLTLMIAGGATETLSRVRDPRSFQKKAMERVLASKLAPSRWNP